MAKLIIPNGNMTIECPWTKEEIFSLLDKPRGALLARVDKKEFQCQKCNKQFWSKKSLKNHKIEVHSY